MIVTGTILNRENLPIDGATIEEIETGNVAFSDANGYFSLDVQSLNSTLEVRHISYKTEYVFASETSKITLGNQAQTIEPVEINIVRKKPNYIGLYVVGIAALVGLIYVATQKPKKPVKKVIL